MAGYCRLSKEDGENRISESIENQKKLILEYVDKAGDMQLVRMYVDDGYSGLYFSNRPQFQQMMADIYRGEIQGVITKDISRLGREHIETGHYIERCFHHWGFVMWRFSMAWIRSVTVMKSWLNSRHCSMICTAEIFQRKYGEVFWCRKSRENICLVLHLMAIEKTRLTGTGF